jgi:hypothetical protein
LPAGDLDALVTGRVLALLRDPFRLANELGDAAATTRLEDAGAALADRLDKASALRDALQRLGASVVVGQESVNVMLNAGALADLLGADRARTSMEQRIVLPLETSLKRRGHELRLVYAALEANPAMRDDRLIRLVASGYAAYDQLLAGHGKPGTTERSHLVRLARLRFLPPDVVTAIVHGRQPVELTSRSLLRAAELPLGWAEQRKTLGFGEAASR